MAFVAGTETPSGTRPQPPTITGRHIYKQFKIDIGGKEVQTSETYSHAWVANQFGHVCLGILLGFSLSATLGPGLSLAVDWFNLPASWVLSFPWDNVTGSLVAVVLTAAWEWRAYRKEAKEAVGNFPLDRKLLLRNAITATAYMVLGVAAAFVFRFFAFGPYDRLLGIPVIVWGGACFVGLVIIGVIVAVPWLRQKIVWQKAAMPYLFRLADAEPATTADAEKLQALINTSPPYDPAQQIVIGGPIGSGRTEIGVGLGTEFAFRNVTVRYVSLATLLEFAARSKNPDYFDDMGPANIDYWGWTRAQVVIIDDIGPVLAGKPKDHFEEFVEILRTQLDKVQAVLQQCHTVWVIGDPRGDGEISAVSDNLLDQYAREIGNYCKRLEDPPQQVVVVHLEPRERRKAPKAEVRYVVAPG